MSPKRHNEEACSWSEVHRKVGVTYQEHVARSLRTAGAVTQGHRTFCHARPYDPCCPQGRNYMSAYLAPSYYGIHTQTLASFLS